MSVNLGLIVYYWLLLVALYIEKVDCFNNFFLGFVLCAGEFDASFKIAILPVPFVYSTNNAKSSFTLPGMPSSRMYAFMKLFQLVTNFPFS